jgi:hypothetical protein
MHNPETNALKVFSTSTSPTSTSFDVVFPSDWVKGQLLIRYW